MSGDPYVNWFLLLRPHVRGRSGTGSMRPHTGRDSGPKGRSTSVPLRKSRETDCDVGTYRRRIDQCGWEGEGMTKRKD